jgi:hypothetical protein
MQSDLHKCMSLVKQVARASDSEEKCVNFCARLSRLFLLTNCSMNYSSLSLSDHMRLWSSCSPRIKKEPLRIDSIDGNDDRHGRRRETRHMPNRGQCNYLTVKIFTSQ